MSPALTGTLLASTCAAAATPAEAASIRTIVAKRTKPATAHATTIANLPLHLVITPPSRNLFLRRLEP
jgi:hypothetical protein